MGNCSGLFANCTGEDTANNAVRKIDTDALAKAVRQNKQDQLDGNAIYGGNQNVNGVGNMYGGGSTKEGGDLRYNESVFGNGQVVGGEINFTKDVREFRPPVNLDSGAVYEGEWLNGMRDGHGK